MSLDDLSHATLRCLFGGVNLGPLAGLVGAPRGAKNCGLTKNWRVVFRFHQELNKLGLGRVLELLVLRQRNEILEGGDLEVLDLVLSSTKDLEQLSPLPVRRDVVVALLRAPDTALNGVTCVIDEEDGYREVETYHRSHLLDGHHSGTVTLNKVDTLVLVGCNSLAHSSTESSGKGKADRRVVVLREVQGILGQRAAARAVLEGTGLGNESVTRCQELGNGVRESELSDLALKLRVREVNLRLGGVDVSRDLDRELLEDTVENVAEEHVVVVLTEDTGIESVNNDQLRVIDGTRHTTRVEVRDMSTDVQDEVAVFLHGLRYTLEGDLAIVDTAELGVGLLDRGSAKECAVAIGASALKDLHSALLHVETSGEEIVKNDRSLRLGESIENGLSNFVSGRVEGHLGSNLLGKVGSADREGDHVSREEESSGFLKLHDLVNEVVDLLRGLLGVPKLLSGAAQWFASLLVVTVVIRTQTMRGRRVVEKNVLVLGEAGRLADDVDDGDVLGIGTRDTVESAQLTDGVGGDNDTGDARLTSVAIGSVSSVQLVTSSNPFEALNIVDVVQKLEVEITRHTEDVLNANLIKTLEKIGTQRDISRHFELIELRKCGKESYDRDTTYIYRAQSYATVESEVFRARGQLGRGLTGSTRMLIIFFMIASGPLGKT